MPLPESSQSKIASCSSDLTYIHDEFVELLWNNGPVMQGQSNRPRKSSVFTALPHCGGVSEKDSKDNPYPKIGHFRATESKLNCFLGFGINAHDDDDDDIGPWINYPMEDPLHNDYCSEFLNDHSRINVNSIDSQTNVVPAIRSSFLEQVGRDSHNVEEGHVMETSRIRPGQPCQLPTQFHSSVSSAKSSEMELGIGNSSKAHRESGGNGLMNSSDFSRPVALARADLQGADRSAGNKNKENFAMNSNPMESTVVESTSALKSVLGTQDQLSSVKPNQDLISSPKRPQELIFIDNICEGENSRKNSNPNHTSTCNGSPERIQSTSFAASAALGRHETEKGNEAAIASSSVCSDSSTGPVSNDHKQRGKGKHQEGEESGYQSEDLEDESVELKKSSTAQGKSKKRSRAAEVHNLSERRRRDRINERMRALQELIPNCNKTDKGSMLDEAIEYLKSLQMQVQMMSMGSRFCMPPVMMQHMRAPAMANFSSMGMGMGMGIGLSYGMGVYDVNGSPGCSFIPVSPSQGPQSPCPSFPVPQGLHRLPGSNSLQMLGIPGQGLPVLMPYHPPPASSTDTKISPVAGTKSENHLQSKGLKKTERSNTDKADLVYQGS